MVGVLTGHIQFLIRLSVRTPTMEERKFIKNNHSISFVLFDSFNFLAFCVLTTFFPVLASLSFLVLPAIVPPCLAIILFSSRLFGFFSLLISVVVASASIFKTNSRLVILSLRFSFFKFLCCLYCFTLLPLHAFVIMPVRVANSCPFFIPVLSHSSVNSFLTSMLFKRWLIHPLL